MNGRWMVTRSLVFSTFLFSIVLFVDKHPPFIFTLRFACFAGRFLRRLCDPSSYFTNHCCERLHFVVTRDYTSMLREITLRCCERLHFDVARDYISIWIIQPAVRFYRRYEWTAEVYSFSRPFFFQLFFLAIKNPRLILLSATSSPLSPVYSYGAYASLPFFILYNSMLREITIQCYERLQIIVAIDYNSMLREITLHHYERLQFNVARDYTSLLREITLVFELYNPP
jgi:hypothetical protein